MHQKKSKKNKHNKKRNTAFLYEVLSRELTKSILKEDVDKKRQIVSIFKNHFRKGTFLSKEMSLYRTIHEMRDLDVYTAEKLLYETKVEFMKMDKRTVFDEQSELISDMNKSLSPEVFTNYVPNYKSLATISQIFNTNLPVKNRVLLEKGVVEGMVLKEEKQEETNNDVDNVVYKSFIKKFNSEYSSLLEEQKQVISKYLMSFADNGLSLKMFLNEEIGRLREGVESSLGVDEVREDEEMRTKVQTTLSILESFKDNYLNEDLLKKVLKIQTYVNEIEK